MSNHLRLSTDDFHGYNVCFTGFKIVETALNYALPCN